MPVEYCELGIELGHHTLPAAAFLFLFFCGSACLPALFSGLAFGFFGSVQLQYYDYYDKEFPQGESE